MVSLARGAASPFKMRIVAERRVDQLTMKRKFTGREAASATWEFGSSSAYTILGQVDHIEERKRASTVADALQQNLALSHLFMVVIGAFAVHSIHVVFHVFYHGVEFGFLFVREHFTHFCVDRVMHALHLGVLIFF
jgi:hypothetical protein